MPIFIENKRIKYRCFFVDVKRAICFGLKIYSQKIIGEKYYQIYKNNRYE